MIAEYDFAGKIVVVTGASRGLGALLTKRFAKAGARVAFAARSMSHLTELQADVRAAGGDATAFSCDVGRADDCRRLISAVLSAHGSIDVLVNNAGISGVQKPAWEVSDAELDEVLRVNACGAFYCMREAAPSMIARRNGVIINIGSVTGKRPATNRLAYATSKMALLGLTRAMAFELAPYRVRCNIVSPGPIEGVRIREVVARAAKAGGLSEAEIQEEFCPWSPMGEMIDPDEICDLILFLALDKCRHITGQDINVDGGIVMS